jgi:tRNA pseudouridine32 synthase/23S rRNA pseudouridine746 synthase
VKEETRLVYKKIVNQGDSRTACELLAQETGLPRMRIKDAMSKGVVWVMSRGKGRKRLRRATAGLKPGDVIELFYDPGLLSREPPQACCVDDRKDYSIWNKPAGLLTQGTDYGDHCSLLRQAETAFTPRREAYPVHRLDREAEGLVLMAHTRHAARDLSRLFHGREIEKRYRAEVLGQMEPAEGVIDLPLDGRPAVTKYSLLSFDQGSNTSRLLVEILTGRLHQIRRHLAGIGHPVMGDPRYGKGNKDGKSMRLTATELKFTCPLTGEKIDIRI